MHILNIRAVRHAGIVALGVISLVLLPGTATAQQPGDAPSGPEQSGPGDAPSGPEQSRPAADPADVATIDAIITASYDVISGPAGDRDWDRERSLFHPDSRHMPTQPGDGGGSSVQVMPVDGFIDAARGFFAQSGFYEYEIARSTQRYGDIAHVLSTYAWSTERDGPVGGRGINSFQLLWDGDRWWILSVFWAQESDDNPIPAEFLPDES